MAANNYFRQGAWNAVCGECGEAWKSNQLRLRWDNIRVCKFCWEPRNAQDFLRGIKDRQSVPYSNPDPSPIFLGTDSQQRTLDSYILDSISLG